jgi:hypothetical protein
VAVEIPAIEGGDVSIMLVFARPPRVVNGIAATGRVTGDSEGKQGAVESLGRGGHR